MNYIGFDNEQNKLQLGDICTFKINRIEYEGMIGYSDIDFAYTFEMKYDTFPSVYMMKADLGSINKIINVWSTDPKEDAYEFYRTLIKEMDNIE